MKHSPVPAHLPFDIPTAGTSHSYFHFFFDRFSTSAFVNLCPKCTSKELQDKKKLKNRGMKCIYAIQSEVER